MSNAAALVAFPPVTRLYPAHGEDATKWSENLTMVMAIDPDGDALVLGALINILPERYTPSGRRDTLYLECVEELFGVAASKTPSMSSKTARAQAASVVAVLAAKVQDFNLHITNTLHAPPKKSYLLCIIVM